MEKSTSFNSRLTNLLLWMQWISLESLLNVSLQAVFYTYIVGCKHKWCRPTRNYCTCTVCSSVWVLVNSSRIYYSLHCTCTHVLYRTFHCPKFHTTHWSAPSESCINLWSTRLARQKSENSAAALPLIGIKCHILSESSVKLWWWQICQTSCQHAALGAEGRKTEDWKQKVSIFTCWFRRAAWTEIFFFLWGGGVFFCCWSSSVLLSYPGEKALFSLQNWLTCVRIRLNRGQVRQEIFLLR